MSLLTCPAPVTHTGCVLLAHGSGGKLSAELLHSVFLAEFDSPLLRALNDQAVVPVGGERVAFTTDSFVVKPLFFPGGSIGELAVNGTINDLAMAGARPLCLSAAFIIEEGFPLDDLRRIVSSFQQAARRAGVAVVTGDTKVVEKGSADGVFINTSGIGLVPEGVGLSADQARPGDQVIVSGSIGDHGIAVMAKREGIEFETTVESDTAPLHTLVETMLAASGQIRCLRDPTRGGLSSTCNEIAQQSQVGIELIEDAIPVREQVKGACELLGLDPLYVANEGKLVAIVAPQGAEDILGAMRSHPLGRDAALIGSVAESQRGLVTMKTAFGTTRIVDMLAGDQLPRIC